MRNTIFKISFFLISFFIFFIILGSDDVEMSQQNEMNMASGSSKLYIDHGATGSELEHMAIVHQDGTPHEYLRVGVASGGKDIVMEESGLLILGSDDVCRIYENLNTYLAVEGNAFKHEDGVWDYTSDKRLKKNITPLKKNQDKFLRVKFYQFTYKKSGKVRYGILADEMKDDFPHSMGSFWENGVEYYTFNPNNLFFMGMKIIQENSLENIEQTRVIKKLETENQRLENELEAERNRNDNQQREIEAIKAALTDLDVDLSQVPTSQSKPKQSVSSNLQDDAPKLEQNIPNPFSQFTSIAYYLPQNTRRATLIIYDMNGKTVSKHVLPPQQGEGKIEVDLNKFNSQSGIYSYSLYVNKRLTGTQQMILTK